MNTALDGSRRANRCRHPGPPALERAAADRHLDQVVTDGGDGHRDADAGQEQRVDAPVQPLPRHHQEDRPVPEVDAVGDAAPLRQGWQLQEADDQGARCHRATEHDGARRQAGQQEPPAESERRRLRRRRPQRGRARHTTQGEHRRHPREPATAAPLAPEREPDGDGRADEEGLGPGVSAVVGAGRVPVGRQQHHEDGGGEGAEAGDGEEDVQAPAAGPRGVVVRSRRPDEEQVPSAQHVDGTPIGPALGAAPRPAGLWRDTELEHRQHHQGPHEIELLFDRQ